MKKRGDKKYSKVRKEVNSFLYEKNREEVESFLDKKNNNKNKTNNKIPKEKKKNMKFGKGDVVFLIVYLFLLFLFLLITPIWITYDSINFVENEFLWENALWILLYAILVPLIYFLLRWGYQRKK